MQKNSLIGDMLLLLTSVIWGFAFVAQRVGMEFIGPFFFNSVRFFIGAIVLIPLLYLMNKKFIPSSNVIKNGFILGLFLFAGASLQQVGIVYTTAGKAGFITGLYVVFTPIFGRYLGHKTDFFTWVGVVFAVIGLYLLSVKEGLYIEKGDFLVLLGSIFWAFHVNFISVFNKKNDALELSIVQYFACAFFSLIVSIFFEKVAISMIRDALWPILYGGLVSVGIGYTMQIFAQKKTSPSHAAIILSMESLFAVLGGCLFLEEVLSNREVIGIVFMFFAIIITQIDSIIRGRK